MSDVDLIETPENVELKQELTGIGTRCIASVVDHLIILAAFLLIIVALIFGFRWPLARALDELAQAEYLAVAVLIVLFFLVHWGYFVFFELRTNGQTPGKKRMRIRVVKEGGSPITFVDIAIRNLLRVVDSLPVGYGVGVLTMFVTKKGQRLGDLAAGTVVISEETHDYSAHADRRRNVDWEPQVTAAALRATGLKPEEYRLLQNYWLRRGELTVEARQRILPNLLRPILQRTGQAVRDESLITLEQFVATLIHKATTADLQAQEHNSLREASQ